MAMGTVVTRRPDVRSRFRRCVCGVCPPMAMGTVVTRRPDVQSRFGRPVEHPMDLGTGLTRRPDVRSRFRRSGKLPMDHWDRYEPSTRMTGRCKRTMRCWDGECGLVPKSRDALAPGFTIPSKNA